MTGTTSLPPHLEQFIREQIASGRFGSEGEVIRAALRLLEEEAHADTPSRPRPDETAGGSSRRPEGPAPTGRWKAPGEWLSASPARETTPAPVRRSPRGLLADLRSGIDLDDIQDARREMWAGLRHGGAG